MLDQDPWGRTRGASAMSLPPPPVARPAPERGRGRLWLTALVAALVAAAVAVPTTLTLAASTQADAPAVSAAIDDGAANTSADVAPADDMGVTATNGVAGVADALLPSVARVDVQATQGAGSGSAVVYRGEGYLITNAHVVANAEQVQVTLPDGSALGADVVGSDPSSDIAVLEVASDDLPEGGLPVPEFAEQLPRVGDAAIAIGSPFGLDGSVTSGVVSAVGRAIPGLPIADAIQTDAPINPGNSGGALADAEARVIAINTAIYSGNPMAPGNVGIGFAIPSTTAMTIADQLIDQGFVEHAQIGIQGQDVDPAVAEAYGLGADEGALVIEVVDGSPAEEAGLARGDIITAFEGEPVTSMAELAGRVRASEPGQEVSLDVVRGGDARTVAVTLGTAEAQPEGPGDPGGPPPGFGEPGAPPGFGEPEAPPAP